MSIFTPPLEYDDKIMEATVTNVDPIRFVCSVKTVRGQYFNEVPWLLPIGGSGKNGMHFAPSIGDQVVLSTGLTYPVIIGSLPRLGTRSTALTNVSGSDLGLDAGNNTNMKNGFVTNPNKPSDFTPGDQVFTSEGGGIFALLANGSLLLKSSTLAQIFITKFDDLVRVVARNWERFSDASQQTAANVKGRLYEYMGWERNLNRSKNGLYELQDVVGDVAAGEVLRGEPNPSVSLPAADDRVRKYWLQDDGGNVRMVEILYEDGKLDLTVKDVAGTTNTQEVQETAKYEVTSTAPSGFSRVTILPTEIRLNHNNVCSTVLDGTNIVSTFGSSKVTQNASQTKAEYGAHFMTVDASGVHLG
jgi:hypothetical protein